MNNKSPTNKFYKSIEDYASISSDSTALVEANVQLAHLNEKLESMATNLFERLVRVAEFRDDLTGKHTERVAVLSARISIRLGMPTEFTELIVKAAKLHDIGKISIPDAILLKSTRLSESEYNAMKTHCVKGADLLTGSDFPLLQMAENIALCHHEKIDGSGYPHQLKDRDIPIEAKIVAVADVFDALCHKRPYKKAWKQQDVLDLLVSKRAIHFDPDVIDVLKHLMTNK